jgi:hypothetical protein
MELLELIAGFLIASRLHVVAVVYLQRITERKLTHSTRSNLQMLRAICGEPFYQNIILLTSMWTKLAEGEQDGAITRELEFNESPKFWGDMLANGAEYFRWDETGRINGAKTALSIIDVCERKTNAPTLNVLLELGKGLALEDTTAGKILTADLIKQQERERQNLLAEQEELEALHQQHLGLEELTARVRDSIPTEQHTGLRRSESLSQSPAPTAQSAVRRREPVMYEPESSRRVDLRRPPRPEFSVGDLLPARSSTRTSRRLYGDNDGTGHAAEDRSRAFSYDELADEVKRRRAKNRWEKLARHLGLRGGVEYVVVRRRK